MEKSMIDRINELYRKSKAEGLTEEELKEQQELRGRYLADIRANVRSTLNTISIKEADGSITNLEEKYGGQEKDPS